MLDALSSLGTGGAILLIVALAIAFGFECINGFHDTANAVATVIYTKSMKPTPAVAWCSGWPAQTLPSWRKRRMSSSDTAGPPSARRTPARWRSE